jgi:hypothetical protein
MKNNNFGKMINTILKRVKEKLCKINICKINKKTEINIIDSEKIIEKIKNEILNSIDELRTNIKIKKNKIKITEVIIPENFNPKDLTSLIEIFDTDDPESFKILYQKEFYFKNEFLDTTNDNLIDTTYWLMGEIKKLRLIIDILLIVVNEKNIEVISRNEKLIREKIINKLKNLNISFETVASGIW